MLCLVSQFCEQSSFKRQRSRQDSQSLEYSHDVWEGAGDLHIYLAQTGAIQRCHRAHKSHSAFSPISIHHHLVNTDRNVLPLPPTKNFLCRLLLEDFRHPVSSLSGLSLKPGSFKNKEIQGLCRHGVGGAGSALGQALSDVLPCGSSKLAAQVLYRHLVVCRSRHCR